MPLPATHAYSRFPPSDNYHVEPTNDKIVTSGLIYHLDAANQASYPGSGDQWYDLVNGPSVYPTTIQSYAYTTYTWPHYSLLAGGCLTFIADYYHYWPGDGLIHYGPGHYATCDYLTGFDPNNWTVEVFVMQTQWSDIYGYDLSDVALVTDRGQGSAVHGPQFFLGSISDYGTGLDVGFYDYDTELWYLSYGGAGFPGSTAYGWYNSIYRWHQIAGSYGDGTLTFWTDGVSRNSYYAGITQTAYTRYGFRMMTGFTDDITAFKFFPGNLAIVRMYNRALTADEILQNYTAQMPRFQNY
jgi:hypothetical protein